VVPLSYLFVPGNRPERFDKACGSGAHAVILDLEDAVAPDAKPDARTKIGAWLQAAEARDRKRGPAIALRINATNTPWFIGDLELCRLPGVDTVLLPKAEHVDGIGEVTRALAPNATVVPIIESALGIERLASIAAAPRVCRLAFGTLDFRVDLGLGSDTERAPDDEEHELAFFRSRIVLTSKVAGLQAPVDGVTTSIDDAARIEAEARRARRFGFGAKLCIHPKQVEPVHRAFLPTAEQVDWAGRVLAAVAESGGSAIQVDGRMVDRPVILEAESILARAGLARPDR
jgi:citrate lyase subunit beta / citryl-CoA lyase